MSVAQESVPETSDIDWNTYCGVWIIEDKYDNPYSIALYSTTAGKSFFEEIYQGLPLFNCTKSLEKKFPQITWRCIGGLYRGGESRKNEFRAMWSKVLSNADSGGIGYTLVSAFSGETHVNIKSQQDLDSYYERRGFKRHQYKGIPIFVRFPKV